MCEKIYKQPYQHEIIMENLNNQRMSGEFCDVTFVVEDKEIKAHKNVLCASSPYFRSMFTDHFQESKLDRIPLHDMDYTALSNALSYIYTASIEITEHSVFEIMDVVDILHLYTLKPYINHYLKQIINDQNCLMIYMICNIRNYTEVAQLAFLHILNNFKSITKSNDFKNIPSSLWIKILKSDVINVESEKKLLEVFLDWYKFDPENRLDDFKDLCLSINLYTLNTSELLECIMETELQSYILKVLEDRSENCRDFNLKKNKQRCNKFNSIIIVMEGACSCSCECFPSLNDPWSFSLPLWGPYNPTSESELVIAACPVLKQFASANNDHEIYLLGGTNETGELTNSCYKYDVRLNTWKDLAKLPVPVKGAAAAFCNDKLYITGGCGQDGLEINVVMYYMDRPGQEERWVTVCPMLDQRSSHALCSVNGVLYAFGGVNISNKSSEDDEVDSIVLQTVEVYCPESDKWHYASGMLENRIMFSSAVLDEFIYIFGGNVLKESGYETCCIVERYDTLNDKWKQLEPMPFVSNNDSQAVAYKNRIYVIGGATKEAELQNSVYAFNPRSNKWQYVPPMRFPRLKPVAAVFQLPEHPTRINERVRATQFRWR